MHVDVRVVEDTHGSALQQLCFLRTWGIVPSTQHPCRSESSLCFRMLSSTSRSLYQPNGKWVSLGIFPEASELMPSCSKTQRVHSCTFHLGICTTWSICLTFAHLWMPTGPQCIDQSRKYLSRNKIELESDTAIASGRYKHCLPHAF